MRFLRPLSEKQVHQVLLTCRGHRRPLRQKAPPGYCCARLQQTGSWASRLGDPGPEWHTRGILHPAGFDRYHSNMI